MTPLAVVILAAGKGTRLESDLPKALEPICGKPMLGYLLDKARALKAAKRIVVAGYRYDDVQKYVGKEAVLVLQKNLLGSGHAVSQAEKELRGFKGPILVLYCDTPLVSIQTLLRLRQVYESSHADCVLLAVEANNPFGYGRIKRGHGEEIEGIVEENDATEEEKNIHEVNVGCYIFRSERLFEVLASIKKNPKKKEYYLTDAIAILAAQGKVRAVVAQDPDEALGVNTKKDLAAVQALTQKNILEAHLDNGVMVRDTRTTWIDADVKIGRGTVIHPHTVIEEATVIGERCSIGPFARIRGGSVVRNKAVIGNFVEVVRSTIGESAQVKHLTYLGDAKIGPRVNVGAGTITANYDGKNKHTTVVGDEAQIGSGTILIAPVTIGRGAKTGAGAVVTSGQNIPEGAVALGVPARVQGNQKNGKKK